MSKKSISSKNKMGKEMTYEEIGVVTGLSPQQVHKIEKDAFNKMVYALMEKQNINIFDSIIAVSSYLGIDVDQSYKKLDKRNKQLLQNIIKKPW